MRLKDLKPEQVVGILASIRVYAEERWTADWLTSPGTKAPQLDNSTWLEMTKFILLRDNALQDIARSMLPTTTNSNVRGEELWVACRGFTSVTEALISQVSSDTNLGTSIFRRLAPGTGC